MSTANIILHERIQTHKATVDITLCHSPLKFRYLLTVEHTLIAKDRSSTHQTQRDAVTAWPNAVIAKGSKS